MGTTSRPDSPVVLHHPPRSFPVDGRMLSPRMTLEAVGSREPPLAGILDCLHGADSSHLGPGSLRAEPDTEIRGNGFLTKGVSGEREWGKQARAGVWSQQGTSLGLIPRGL